MLAAAADAFVNAESPGPPLTVEVLSVGVRNRPLVDLDPPIPRSEVLEAGRILMEYTLISRLIY